MNKLLAQVKKEYLIAAVGIFLILLVLFYMFIVAPSLRAIAKLSKKEKTLLSQINEADSIASNKTSLSSEVGEIAQKIEYYEKLLPRNIEMSQILIELAQRGKENRVTIVSLEPQKINRIQIGQAAKYCLEIPIKLSIKAGFHDFAGFIQGIENSQRFMKIDDISIKADPADKFRHNISLILIAFALEG